MTVLVLFGGTIAACVVQHPLVKIVQSFPVKLKVRVKKKSQLYVRNNESVWYIDIKMKSPAPDWRTKEI